METEANDNRKTCGPWFKVRYVIVALLFLSTVVGYSTRVVLSVTIVPMLNNTVNPAYPQFNWDEEGREGLVLSSFFWGYAVAQIPSGILVQFCGPKWPLFGSACLSSVCIVILPAAAMYGGWVATCVVRVVQGISQGALFPSLFATMALWTPLEERGRLATIVFSGCQIGTIIAFPIAGFLVPSAGGWPSVYYVFGCFGLAWAAAWYFVGSSSPSVHPFIRSEERELIESSILNKFETKLKPPWKEIFKCPSVWALIVMHCSNNYGFWSLIAEIPTYMDSVLHFKIEENGMLSALPYLVMAVLSFASGATADLLFNKKLVSVGISRKIFNTVGFWIPAAALTGLGFVTKDHQTTAVALLIIAVGFNGASYAGFQLGHMDISPNFAGMLMGITNCAANVFSIIGMITSEFLIRKDKTNVKNWQIVFSVSASLMFLGNLFYIFIFRAKRQPWNEPDFEPENKN